MNFHLIKKHDWRNIMYLLYIDDSGTCEITKSPEYNPQGKSRYFVLGAILIKANELNKISDASDIIKEKCLGSFLNEIKYSIKGLKCQNVCQKNNDRNCFRTQIAGFIANTDCTVFACVQDKYENYQNNLVKSKDDVYTLSFQHLLKIVDDFMYKNSNGESIITFIDKKDTGSSKDDLIYKAYKEALSNTKIFRSFSSKIFSPTLNVVYSQYTLGAQLADFVAGTIFTFYENMNNEKVQEKTKKLTLAYRERVYQKNNKILGLVFADKKLI